MNNTQCKPRLDNNIFLVACILFSLSFLYMLYSIFNLIVFNTFLNAVFAAAICVLFFLSFLGKIRVFIPFIVIAVDLLLDNINGYIGGSGFFGLLAFAAAVLAVLSMMGIVSFDLKIGLGEKLKSKAGDPCLIAAAVFVVCGIVSVIQCISFVQYGLSIIYIINKLCYFAGAALALYSLEITKTELLVENTEGSSYQEAREQAKAQDAANNIKYQTFKTAEGEVPMELVTPENIVKNVVLGVITLGIYWFIWWYRVCRRVRHIEGKDPACGTELVCIMFVPFYAIYWFYTRGQRLSDGAKRFGVFIKDNSVLYIVLAIFGLSIVSFILIQTELNTFADKLRLGIKDNIDNYNNTNAGYNAYSQQQRPQEAPVKEEAPVQEAAPQEAVQEETVEAEPEAEVKPQTKQSTDEILETIKKLSELKEQGILSEEEFAAKKAELLERM